jgi:primosomal replication protein N
VNCLILTARVVEVFALRYTPAGLPALDVVLQHESQIQDAGNNRTVMATLRARAVGDLAQDLIKMELHRLAQFEGFLSTPKHSKVVVFHLTHFQYIQ